MIGLCAALYGHDGHDGPALPSPEYMAPRHLARLIRLVFRYVRPADDTERTGVQAPRDDAQGFRGSLLSSLADSLDPIAGSLLEDLRNEPCLASRREYIVHLIQRRRTMAAERPPLTPSKFREFRDAFAYSPRTDYEFFRLALARFADIKRSVERARVSARGDLHRDDDEARLRQWLARQLTQAARGHYTVPQEEEIDAEKYPDLHLEAPGVPALPIEIKWADGSSYGTLSKLLERLENQLLGDYLRPAETRYGIFLIAAAGRKSYWLDLSGHRLALNGLRTLLQSRADQLVAEREDVQAVQVVSIDFAPTAKGQADRNI